MSNAFSSSDPQSVAALLRAGQDTNLIKLFERALEALDEKLRKDDTDNFRRLQGRAQIIEEFLEAVVDAPSVVERLNKSR